MTVRRVAIKREYMRKISETERWRKLALVLFDMVNQERTRHGVAAITKKQFINYLKSK